MRNNDELIKIKFLLPKEFTLYNFKNQNLKN